MPLPTQRTLLLLSLSLALDRAGPVGAANVTVATFNETHVASLATTDASNTGFELRTSHPAWTIWAVKPPGAGAADEPLLRLGLTPDTLSVTWTNGSAAIRANLTDGNWHAIRIRMDYNSSGLLVLVIDAVETPPISAWTPVNRTNASAPLTMSFGGVNGTGGLRGCLANASLNSGLGWVDLASNDAAGGPVTSRATPGCSEDRCPCANSGSCLPHSQWNLHSGCNCSGTAFQGAFCQQPVDFCQPVPPKKCSGRGQCVSIPGRLTFECNCSDTGYLGSFCQSRDPCLANPCGVNGNCSYLGNSDDPSGNFTYLCACTPGFTGLNCSVSQPIPQQPPSDTRIVVGLVVGLLLLLLIGTTLGLLGQHLRNRRKDTGVYKPSDRELGTGNGTHNLRNFLHPPTEERLV